MADKTIVPTTADKSASVVPADDIKNQVTTAAPATDPKNTGCPTTDAKKHDGMTLYVLYAVRLDGSCLKNSDIDIIGVYDNEMKAREVQKLGNERMRSDDDVDPRCNYVSIHETRLNEEGGLSVLDY
jgi:hypothetical protein